MKVNEVAGHTTAFQDDGQMKLNDNRLQQDLQLSVPKFDDNSIKLFLAKPKLVRSGKFTSADLPNDALTSFSIGNELINDAFWTNKMQGYRYIRGTAVIRLVVNAQPFQAGRLLLHALPCYENVVAITPAFAKHNVVLAQKTVHPNVELDLRDTAVELRMPYVSPYQWFDIPLAEDDAFTKFGDWGTVWLTVLSSLRALTLFEVSYSIFLHFEEVEMAAPWVVESARTTHGRKLIQRERKNLAKPTGTISSTLDALRDPISAFSRVPFIGKGITDVADALLEGASGILSVFGYSKPTDMSKPQIMLSKPHHQVGNFNGSNFSDVIALDAGNQIPAMSNFSGTDLDEMSFSYLKKIPAYTGFFEWSASDIEGALIHTIQLSPRFIGELRSYTLSGKNFRSQYPPPYGYLAHMFDQYRGGQEITLKFVKTQYHSGRLVISYVPGSVTTSIDATQLLYREIVDLRESSEITLKIPYMFNTPYVDTSVAAGLIQIHVLNELECASTVSQTIDVLVYANAADDFELAVPSADRMLIVPEGGEMQHLVTKGIGGVSIPDPSLGPSESCVGEIFVSLKQLLMSSRLWFGRAFDTTTIGNYTIMNIKPFFHVLYSPDVAAATNGVYKKPPFGVDYLSKLATGFLFERGGIRLTQPASSSVNGSTYANLARRINDAYSGAGYDIINPDAVGPFTVSSGIDSGTAPLALRGTSYQGVLDITVPHYAKTHIRFVRAVTDTAAGTFVSSDDYPKHDCMITFRTQTLDNLRGSLRGAADDYALGYFIGFFGIAEFVNPL
jgi:hypothetical protein